MKTIISLCSTEVNDQKIAERSVIEGTDRVVRSPYERNNALKGERDCHTRREVIQDYIVWDQLY